MEVNNVLQMEQKCMKSSEIRRFATVCHTKEVMKADAENDSDCMFWGSVNRKQV